MRISSIEQLPPGLQAQARAALHPWRVPTIKTLPPKRNKYCAKPAWVDGVRFPSKLEAERYIELKRMRKSGEHVHGLGKLIHFALWPKFALPGGVICELDSVQIWQDGPHTTVVWEDVKGHYRQDSRNKHKQVKALYGIEVQIWPAR